MKVQVSISLGELVDKISILKIKSENINDTDKLKLVHGELTLLESQLSDLHLEGINEHLDKLMVVNKKLWDIEDEIRVKEKANEYDDGFIQLSRSVYLTNDQRFELKNIINNHYGSDVKEVKSYEQY
jgi:hypothetical protein